MALLNTASLFPLAALLLLPALPLRSPGQDAAELEPGALKSAVPPEQAMKGFSVAPGLQVDVWAAEPLLVNPVAFSFDEQGRCFVAETYRRHTSTPDIRKNMAWLLPDLAFRSVEDRESFLKSTFPESGHPADKTHPDFNHDGKFDWRDMAVESERIKLLEDRHDAGKADAASVYAEGFNSLATTVGAGVLAHGGQVWYACIPDLWRIESSSAAGAHPVSLAHGFGVHISYSGHDMHGVKLGPDGRIYWSIADCGANFVTAEGRTIKTPDTGAVFRMNPDGTGMELFASGLRNPESLAFNDLGDLFTGDNNADGGDRARWLHLVEGGDYGWRMGWQFLPKLGAWNSEKLWELESDSSAAYLLPPVGHVGHGPAGIAYYPGTGLPESYREHFFYADFPGGVRDFALQRQGASYTLENPKDILLDNSAKKMTGKLLWGLSPSDVGFNTNGGVYVLDWVQGWEKTGQGRIFRVHDEAVDRSPIVLETKKLLAEGMAGRTGAALVALLGHPDQRVRLEAQYALAEQGAAALPLLTEAARREGGPGPALLARLHAIWALGQIGRHSAAALPPLAALLQDRDGEVRAQAAKILGEARRPEDQPQFLALLRDPEPRAAFQAALALWKSADPAAVPPLLELLRTNDARDAFLRHAAALALSTCAPADALAALAHDPSAAVRSGAIVALRRQQSPAVSGFLADAAPANRLEAARAIHDAGIDAALPALAALPPEASPAAPLARRLINANYLLGTEAAAQTLARLAGDSALPESVRLDALDALGNWNTALGRDRITGLWRLGIGHREARAAATAAAPLLPQLLSTGTLPLRLAAAEAAAGLRVAGAENALLATSGDARLEGSLRAAALRALASFHSPKLAEALQTAFADQDKTVLQEARRLSAVLSPQEAAARSAAVLEKGSLREQQSTWQTVATLPPGEADQLIRQWLVLLGEGKVPPALQLDLLEAAAERDDPATKAKLAAYETARPPHDPLARWRECLEGGDAKAGRDIFTEKAEAACLRCHKIRGVGGDVGPDLGHLGAQHPREYILTSIVLPNAMYAPGYEIVVLTLKNGQTTAGLLTAEDAQEITLTPIGGGPKTKVQKSDVTQRLTAPSPMPEGLGEVLGKRDLRNVVEYLAGMK